MQTAPPTILNSGAKSPFTKAFVQFVPFLDQNNLTKINLKWNKCLSLIKKIWSISKAYHKNFGIILGAFWNKEYVPGFLDGLESHFKDCWLQPKSKIPVVWIFIDFFCFGTGGRRGSSLFVPEIKQECLTPVGRRGVMDKKTEEECGVDQIQGEKKHPTREFSILMEGCKEGKWCWHQGITKYHVWK